MKVLFVHNSSDLYGASQSLLRLAGALPPLGFQPTILLPVDGPLGNWARAAGLPVRIQPSLRVIRRSIFNPAGLTPFFLGFPSAVLETARWIRREGFNLVHTNLGTVVSSAWSARCAGVPHIWHMRDWFQEFGVLWRPYAHYILGFSQKVICVSEPVARQFPVSPKICVLHNGLDLAKFPILEQGEQAEARRRFGFEPHETVVGTVGRIKFVRKGQEYLLQAVHVLRQQGLTLRVLLAGGAAPGSENHIPRMKALAQELGLENAVVFAGEMSDPRPAYAAMDCFVLPSAQPEPFGGVVLEAMALQLPVVATAIGGSPEQVVSEVTGFLVPPADPYALAEKLRVLFLDPSLRERMGNAGRARVGTHFSLSRTVQGVASIYRQVSARAL